MLKTLKSLCATLAISFASAAYADEVLLTVSGDVGLKGNKNTWTFDRKALEALPSKSIDTTTIWTEGTQSFEGVSLDVLLDHVQAEQGIIRAVALNDYAVTIPTSDATDVGPIVAYLRDGKAMSVRDKGPLWIIYPYDANEAYQSEEIYARSIWQLNRLEVVAQ
ncbi:oxidoreductase [Roseibium sp. RKSG952]|uniref:oxidoreductase n=1 Tax=Roseibium sp. RKSG952 TaxID=2529384 RepID=UPI0012BB5092|nr:oxidoreductase [Roseibium sp. RKSG952]MTI03336.1 oxidoreductase [Roseibium sp. RKSG952]